MFYDNMSYSGCRMQYTFTSMANFKVDFRGGGYGDEMGNVGG